MNGVSVYPVQKTQNAPTWQVENQGRGGCFFGIFSPIFLFSIHTLHIEPSSSNSCLLVVVPVQNQDNR